MAYNDYVERGNYPSYTSGANGANALINEDVMSEIIKGVTHDSAALNLFKTRNMGTAQTRIPCLSAKPTAYFVSGDTGLKQTSTMTWENKFLEAEEIAVIVPIPEKLLEDSSYDLWAEVEPEITEAIAVALDSAIFFGINAPGSWPDSIREKCTDGTTLNEVAAGSGIDIADDINNVMAAVEADGFDVTAFWMANTMKAALRGLRDNNDALLFQPYNQGVERTSFAGMLYNTSVTVSMSGVYQAQVAANISNPVRLIAGDWNQGLIGVRQDITGKLLTEAALYDGSGNLQFNLPQQDMVAMRFVARYAWQVPNPLNRIQSDATIRYPFAVLNSASNDV